MKKQWILMIDGKIDSRHETKEQAIIAQKQFQDYLESDDIKHLTPSNFNFKIYEI